MKAIFETTGGIVRFFNDDAEFGDPFEFALFVIGDEGVATLKGLKADSTVPVSVFAAVRKCLKERGFTEVVWHRWEVDKITGERKSREVRAKL